MEDVELNIVDFDQTTELDTTGWNPLVIEHVTEVKSGMSWLFWRVRGTDHVFKIQYQTIVQRHSGDLKEHFEFVLDIFRKDFLSWKKEGCPEEWQKKYEVMFDEYIKM